MAMMASKGAVLALFVGLEVLGDVRSVVDWERRSVALLRRPPAVVEEELDWTWDAA